MRLNWKNTLRNQILVIFLFVMIIVLSIVGIVSFFQVSSLVKSNAERQLQQTAIEANGRMETLYQQVDTLSNQLITNGTTQQILLEQTDGSSLDFSQRQALEKVMRNLQAYSDAVASFELYSAYGKRIYPYEELRLSERVDRKWIVKADAEQGKAVWVGNDPYDGYSSIIIRRVNLLDRSYSNGGYLVVRLYNKYFQVKDVASKEDEREYMMLLDRDLKPITSNYEGDLENLLVEGYKIVTIKNKKYMIIKQPSKLTGWTLVILMPMNQLMAGVSVVRTSIFVAGAIGFVIFAILSFFISSWITKPMLKLTNTMKNAKLDELTLSPEMATSAPDEFKELNVTYNQMVENTNHLIQEVYEKELLRSRTELKALEAQINPHFLYNTLNALYWSLEEKGEEELSEYVISMSDLFRYTIGNQNKGEWVTITEALEHIQRYLKLMKMRLGDRLNWEIQAEPTVLTNRIPKLMIQPLVENAIVHGIENKSRKGTVSVKVALGDNAQNIVISVIDNGPGIDKVKLDSINCFLENEEISTYKLEGMGLALNNVNKRLKLYYQKNRLQGLRLESETGKGTRVSFEIPLDKVSLPDNEKGE